MKMLVAALAVGFMLPGLGSAVAATSAERVQITGEVMDTWCYTSEIMGGRGRGGIVTRVP